MYYARRGGFTVQKSDEILPGASIERFLQEYSEQWNAETRRSYGRSLNELKAFLGKKSIPGIRTLEKWCASLRTVGYSERSINLRISAANNYFRWCGRTDLLMHHRRTETIPPSPELTRSEYLRLLKTARTLGKQRLYLLIKLFATTDLPLQCLEQVTTETICRGDAEIPLHGSVVSFECPDGLREELLAYASERQIEEGPIFVTRSGQPLNRSNLCREMQELCRKAGIEEQKGNPRSLRNLYQATQKELRADVEKMVHQAYKRLLQQEQTSVGWREEF